MGGYGTVLKAPGFDTWYQKKKKEFKEQYCYLSVKENTQIYTWNADTVNRRRNKTNKIITRLKVWPSFASVIVILKNTDGRPHCIIPNTPFNYFMPQNIIFNRCY